MHVSSKCTINFAFWFSYDVFSKKLPCLNCFISFCPINFFIYSETAFVSVCTFFSPLLFVISLCLSCTVECRCSMFLIMLIFRISSPPFYLSKCSHPSGFCFSSIFIAVHLIFASPFFPFP
jgi:hypothetical protein